MNFITIRANITQQQAHTILNNLDKMAQVHEIAAFCGNRILYIDYIAGQIKYRFVSRIPNPHRNVAEISRQEVLQLMSNQ
jgi:hypothetical protein